MSYESEIESLRQRLALAELAQQQAEQQLQQEKQARHQAEQARHQAEQLAQQEKQARHQAEQLTQQQAQIAFLNSLIGMSGSSSVDSRSEVDQARRCVPVPVRIRHHHFLSIRIDPKDLNAAWINFRDWLGKNWLSLDRQDKLNEKKHLHPVIGAMLDSVARFQSNRRIWHENKSEDNIQAASIIPDFSVTHRSESQSSLINNLFFVEVKLPGKLGDALRQGSAYCRRAIRVHVEESLERGESADALSSMAVVTDGKTVSLVVVKSGAPAPGGSWIDCIPCPSEEIEPLPLMPDWDFIGPPQLPGEPTEGFELLFRLFAATDLDLGVATRAPLTRVVLRSPELNVEREYSLNMRLGSGGSSDAYSAGDDQVIKLARFASAKVLAAYKSEIAFLEALSASDSSHIPRLVFAGDRVLSAIPRPTGFHASSLLLCPGICMTPEGSSLADWVDQQEKEEGWSRERCADVVLTGLLAALRCAHAAGFVHCDIRPRNIVVANQLCVLVDWGLCLHKGEKCHGRGVPPYAASAVFDRSCECVACSNHDVEAAVYTWLSVIYGLRCEAPWIDPCSSNDNDVLNMRKSWFTDAVAVDDVDSSKSTLVGRAIHAIDEIQRLDQDAVELLCSKDGAASFWQACEASSERRSGGGEGGV